MRGTIAGLFFATSVLIGSAATAQPVNPPAANNLVSISTSTSTYTGVFLREQVIAGEVYWVIQTGTGSTMIARSGIRGVQSAQATPVISSTPAAAAPATAGPAAASAGAEVRIHGSNTIGAKLMPEIARSFAEKNGFGGEVSRPGPTPEEFDNEYSRAESDQRYLFRFKARGSSTAFESLVAGTADIGMSSRPINAAELSAAAQAGLGNLQAAKSESVLALDGVAVVVHPSNPVAALTIEQISRMFAGEITNWADVGGPPGPVTLYSRDSRSGTFDTFKALTLDIAKRKLSPSAKTFESSEQLSESVSRDPSGIGFIGFAYIGNVKPVTVGTSCGLRFKASPFSVKTEEYPLSRRLHLYTAETRRNATIDSLLSFGQANLAQKIVAANGFINLGIDEADERYVLERGQYRLVTGETPNASAPRLMQGFAQRIVDSTRLSVTFRFRTNSADLDSRALDDVRRLADYLRERPGAVRNLMLFGFADPRGNFERNIALSRERAEQVAKVLRDLGADIPVAQVQGFGIIAPVACSDSEQALEKNRRVEVWLRK